MGSANAFFWAFMFGAVGLGYFVYGKKQQRLTPLLCGIALMVYPYFVSGALLVVLIGIVLMAIPFFFERLNTTAGPSRFPVRPGTAINKQNSFWE